MMITTSPVVRAESDQLGGELETLESVMNLPLIPVQKGSRNGVKIIQNHYANAISASSFLSVK